MKKIILMGIILLAFVTISGVSAVDDAILNDSISESVSEDISCEIAMENMQEMDESQDFAIAELSSDNTSGHEDIIKSTYLTDENSYYLQSNESSNDRFEKNDTTFKDNFIIEFYDDYYLYEETNIFGFLMPNDVENNVSVEIDGELYNYTKYDINNLDSWVWGGNANTQIGYMVKFSDLTLGNHTVLISYPGDGKYAENQLERIITVHSKLEDITKLSSKLTAIDVAANYNSGKNLVATLKDENGNSIKKANIQIKINGQTKKLMTDNKGQVKLTTNNLVPKKYTATISYLGDDYFSDCKVKANVVIKKAIPKLSASKKTFKKSLKTKKYTITLKVNNKAMKNTKVYLKIKGKTFTAKTNKYGKATFKITKINKKGTYKTTITYKGNGNYAKKVVNTKITLK